MSRIKAVIQLFKPLTAAVLFLAAAELWAFEKTFPKSIDDIRRVKAESWSVTGRNMHLKGKIHIPAKDMEINADEAIINLDSHDIEVFGNITVNNWMKVSGTVTPERMAELQDKQNMLLKIDGIEGNIWGEKSIRISGRMITLSIKCDKLSGNLKTGYFHFKNLTMLLNSAGVSAESAERTPDGVIRTTGTRISGCGYIANGNEHYSISAGNMVFKPYETGFYDLENFNGKHSEYDITMTNALVNVYGVPVLWMPYFWKPKDESPGLFNFTWGKNSDWGYFASASKKFTFTDNPEASIRVLADYYSKRGFGYGIKGRVLDENSKTELTAYSIHDLDPFEAEDYNLYRLKVPEDRYMFRLTHLTHVTPRLDFRAQFHWMSDYYFSKDFFHSIYNADTQPSTFAAVEHQFDNFSFAAMFRPRVNRFYTTVEKLPEIRFDIPRQEIFNTGVYYQGDLSADYLSNKWIRFNKDPRDYVREWKLKDYQSFRFDTTHFLYLPVNLDWINFIPRAGVKFTAYSKTSKNRVSPQDLLNMIAVSHPQNLLQLPLNQYDGKGGAGTRLASELGFELSSKFHNTWNDLRINAMGIDGLRHVVRPYVNYTYINVAGKNRNRIYYFDDIDRIDDQNFFRFGLENRLQTRTNDGIRNILSMENFWDLHLKTSDGFGNINEFSRVGDLGTVVSLSPLKNLTISSSLLVALDDQNGDVPDTLRNGRNAGKTGINCKWLNRWNIGVSYTPIEDVMLNLTYYYNRPYSTRSAYSMGSTLTQIESGGYFDRYYDDHNEELTFSVTAPVTPDRRTYGAVSCSYDFYDGGFTNVSFSVLRRFHCVELIAMLSFDRDFEDDDDDWETSFSMHARLLALEAPLTADGNELLRIATSRTASSFGTN